jgi:hypothetical protein
VYPLLRVCKVEVTSSQCLEGLPFARDSRLPSQNPPPVQPCSAASAPPRMSVMMRSLGVSTVDSYGQDSFESYDESMPLTPPRTGHEPLINMQARNQPLDRGM